MDMAGELFDMDYMWYRDAVADAEYKPCPECGGIDGLVDLCPECLGAGEVLLYPDEWREILIFDDEEEDTDD